MTKVMFQVGLLGFFVSTIFFGTRGMPLMDMVLRSFIVFIGVVLSQTAIFVMVASMKSTKKHAHEKPQEAHPHPHPHAAAPEAPVQPTTKPS
jgi:hypothetical protein